MGEHGDQPNSFICGIFFLTSERCLQKLQAILTSKIKYINCFVFMCNLFPFLSNLVRPSLILSCQFSIAIAGDVTLQLVVASFILTNFSCPSITCHYMLWFPLFNSINIHNRFWEVNKDGTWMFKKLGNSLYIYIYHDFLRKLCL